MREVLPIVGAEVGSYFGAPPPARRFPWWRRALNRLGHACLRLANVPRVNVTFVLPGNQDMQTERQRVRAFRLKGFTGAED